jgi:hypothetical protein
LHFFVSAHNKSTSIYGFSPEQLHFGFSNPAITDLIEIWPKTIDQQDYAKQIFSQIEKARHTAREKAKAWNKTNITYRNQKGQDKKFSPGQIVLHHQLQVSTGSGSTLKPLFTGPYIVNSIDKDKSSASLEHLHTGREISAHFTNIKIFHFDPSQSRLPQDFNEQIVKLFLEKYSFAYYHPRSVEKRKKLNKRAKALQREQEYLDEMPLAQRFPSHHSKSHSTEIQTKALNQNPNLQSIKITLDPSSSQIRKIDNPLDNLTYDQVADTPFFDEGLGTEFSIVEQNFDPTHLANNYNEQFPRHTQNSNDDPNDQIYNCDDLQDEPHFLMRANFRTDDSFQNDSQFMRNDTHRLMTKAQVHNSSQNLPSNEQKSQQNAEVKSSNDDLKSQKRNFYCSSETQRIANDTFRHGKR